jgi:hypothetical protein
VYTRADVCAGAIEAAKRQMAASTERDWMVRGTNTSSGYAGCANLATVTGLG